ncbi:peptide/nickel transport system permease protein [Sedimentibacter acidaminivorans]|uniref:Peptide/nickel transport system permease protein n=1 Tax=Sedimentibacter acidaminivorans TaxID=913099 RepID=A0ABS4GFV6_9FIRM|nr:hypothetical protein [Sedimentibacter acidaminivorans]MBP1926265.1 peptide/nickel transport system permease protein [Sedimentibacter acidaminivorans]
MIIKNLSRTKRICSFIIFIYIVIAIISNFIMPFSIDDFSSEILQTPSFKHILGTDEMGHDLFSLLLNGFKISILISIISGILSTTIGVILSFVSCYYKGIIDNTICHIANLLIIIPEIIIIMFFAIFASPTMINTILAIVFFSWTKVFKMARSKLMGYMDKNKVKYTFLIKGNIFDIFKKLYYDLYPVVITSFILQCNKAVMYETTLSFFGIGDPLSKTWGKLIKSAMNYENLFYDNVIFWYLFPPVICVFIYILSLSLLIFDEK